MCRMLAFVRAVIPLYERFFSFFQNIDGKSVSHRSNSKRLRSRNGKVGTGSA
jgi:hypothetical protein